ncbi:ABC transporter ATP-binding protein [Brucepastera parasyntrophica]|uniref:ABC transporter ATP-binding protein n=1 Tax=Brucepastera parasyntrophica TaxID=2880008 RepID=UPI0021090C79|nr:ABC transporter ATP-binding protein [Brucepastera parasyntrophica]ULQ58508.1 ABC transporter ATP-binding protein [Brucepastera parasyntrophica]
MVRVSNISKSFGAVKALDNISFNVKKGELYGITGPDGAGKTTLFRILSTLTLADKGGAEVDGLDLVKDYMKIRNRIGYMPGRFSLYTDLTVEENLTFFATVFNTTVEENYDLIKDIYHHIEPFKKRRAGKLSGGMKQKLALSCALIHKPVVLFLDEPTTGVDPVSRTEFWDMLNNLKEQGITIIVSTPYMDEAARCDRVALIKNGVFLKEDTPANIVNSFNQTLWAIKSDHMRRLLADVRQYAFTKGAFAFGEELHAVMNDGADMGDLRDRLAASGHGQVSVRDIEPTIEDCFIWAR